MKVLNYILIFVLGLGAIGASTSLFTVEESEKALVTRFQKLKSEEYNPEILVSKNDTNLENQAIQWIREQSNFFNINNPLLFVLSVKENKLYYMNGNEVLRSIEEFLDLPKDAENFSKIVRNSISNYSGKTGILGISFDEKGTLLNEIERLKGTKESALVYGPGLHFKIPFIEQKHKLDAKLQTLSIPSSENVLTKGKKAVSVDMYVIWKIIDMEMYHLTVKFQRIAEDRLRQRVNDSTLIHFGKKTLQEAVSGFRGELTDDIEKGIDIAHLGIKIEDVKLKKLDLPNQVSNSIYSRMRTERETIAKEYRAEGKFKAEEIRAEADKDKRLILAEAQRKSEIIKGEGDSEATQIYAETYNQAPDFFAFLKSLSAYKNSFNQKNDFLVLKPEGEFFEFFTDKGK